MRAHLISLIAAASLLVGAAGEDQREDEDAGVPRARLQQGNNDPGRVNTHLLLACTCSNFLAPLSSSVQTRITLHLVTLMPVINLEH
jgi:hypothetical protein